MKKIIYTTKAPEPIGPYSQAIFVNNMLFVSGQLGIDPQTGELISGTIKEETIQVLNNIKEILHTAELNFSNVVKATIFIRNMEQFSEINEAYSLFFGESRPARETVEVSKLPKNGNIEISVIAVQ